MLKLIQRVGAVPHISLVCTLENFRLDSTRNMVSILHIHGSMPHVPPTMLQQGLAGCHTSVVELKPYHPQLPTFSPLISTVKSFRSFVQYHSSMSLVSTPSLGSISVPHTTPRHQGKSILCSSESPASQASPSTFETCESLHKERVSASSSSGVSPHDL